MYVEAKSDRVTVIFSTIFKDEQDIVIGKKKAKKNQVNQKIFLRNLLFEYVYKLFPNHKKT
ncbi:hypothetical protein RND71_043651 [Anisodus tanguticus]|uniref:Arp2/3 complex 34 kDa subunit n=1 Tax=Anisodus tanguticus TaxID=243964 RepID=A0AAE1QNH3_9SOLA|nr:hypothetical protein RND71_043651 [Anisodus tanguticus]